MVLDNAASAYDAPRFGRYAPRLLVGGGDSLHVFIADHLGTAGPRRVVLYGLRSVAAGNPLLRARFDEAARRALRLCHPNIIHAQDADLPSPTPYLVTEWLEGVSLAEFFATVGRTRMKLNQLIWILTEVLNALCYLHELRGLDGNAAVVTHAEVTPSSVFLTSGGLVKLLNPGFGAFLSGSETRKTEAQAGAGVADALAYAAPEQCLGLPLDARADVYSVGALLWEAIAGRARSTGETDLLRAEARFLNSEPSILEIWPTAPPALAGICIQALEPNRDDRFSSAREFKEALERYLATTGDEFGNEPLAQALQAEFSERFSAIEADLAVTASPHRRDSGFVPVSPGPGSRPPISLLALAAPSSNLSLSENGQPSLATRPSRNPWLVAAAVFVAIGIGGAVAWRKELPHPEAARVVPTSESPAKPDVFAAPVLAVGAAVSGESPALSTIELDIATEPPGTLFVDGKLLGASPYKGSVVADGREHIVLATASGRVPEERVISYRSSVTLRFQLAKRRAKQPSPAAP